MNYGSPWGVAAEQVKRRSIFHKLELINFNDLSPSPIRKLCGAGASELAFNYLSTSFL